MSAATYDLHVAGFADLPPRTAYLLWQLREQVFVVEQACAYLELDGRDLEQGTQHLWAEDEHGPVGYVRLLHEGERVRIGRVVVAREHRGTGLSGTLMRAALEVVGDRSSYLYAQSPLAGWYATFGYEQDGADFVEDDIPHTPMSRRPGESTH